MVGGTRPSGEAPSGPERRLTRARVVGALPHVGVPALLAALVVWFGAPQFGHPWWANADPDGAYVGSALNILVGNHTGYLDHPGLPVQEALALGFGAWYLADDIAGGAPDRETWIDRRQLDFDGMRPVYFGLSLLVHVGGALLAYALLTRLLGHWTWGLAAGLLFIAAPKLVEHTYNLRPDTAVAALCLGAVYLIAIALERASAGHLLAAGVTVGFAITVKLVALALLVPLAVAAALLRPRDWVLPTRDAAAGLLRRHRSWLVPVAAVWLLVCVALNRDRLPVVSTDAQRGVLVNGGTFVGGFVLAAALAQRFNIPGARNVFSPFNAALVLAVVVGVAIPATFVLDDGIQMVASIWSTLTGSGVNEGVEPFSEFRLADFRAYPLFGTAVVLLLGLAAAIVGARRRCWWPAVAALGVVLLTTMAAARLSEDYYYAPAYAAAIPGALWLFARPRRAPTPALVWLVVAVVFLPLFRHPIPPTSGAEEVDAAAQQLADELLEPGEVIVAAAGSPIEDLFFPLVENFSDRNPEFPRRFIDATWIPQARERGLTPAYYVAGAADVEALDAAGELDLGEGPVPVRALDRRWGPDGRFGVVELLSARS